MSCALERFVVDSEKVKVEERHTKNYRRPQASNKMTYSASQTVKENPYNFVVSLCPLPPLSFSCLWS